MHLTMDRYKIILSYIIVTHYSVEVIIWSAEWSWMNFSVNYIYEELGTKIEGEKQRNDSMNPFIVIIVIIAVIN